VVDVRPHHATNGRTASVTIGRPGIARSVVPIRPGGVPAPVVAHAARAPIPHAVASRLNDPKVHQLVLTATCVTATRVHSVHRGVNSVTHPPGDIRGLIRGPVQSVLAPAPAVLPIHGPHATVIETLRGRVLRMPAPHVMVSAVLPAELPPVTVVVATPGEAPRVEVPPIGVPRRAAPPTPAPRVRATGRIGPTGPSVRPSEIARRLVNVRRRARVRLTPDRDEMGSHPLEAETVIAGVAALVPTVIQVIGAQGRLPARVAVTTGLTGPYCRVRLSLICRQASRRKCLTRPFAANFAVSPS
jgi:hypothetical protein